MNNAGAFFSKVPNFMSQIVSPQINDFMFQNEICTYFSTNFAAVCNVEINADTNKKLKKTLKCFIYAATV